MATVELDVFDPPGGGPGPSTLRHRQRRRVHEERNNGARDPPMTPAVATGLRLLTTFTLPPKYDHLPVVSRLWLQSRVLDPPPDTWEDEGDVALAPAGEARRITWRNFKIGADIIHLLGPRTAALILQYRSVLALPSLVYLTSVVADGVVPAAA